MKRKALTILATAATAAAAGTTAAAYALFHKAVDIGNNHGTVLNINMGTDWEQYEPLVKEKIQWLIEQQPETHYIITSDKLKLTGKFLPAAVPTHKTVIAVHGYRSRGIYEFSAIVDMYHTHGYNVLLLDNRAHGESEGRYAGFGILDRYDLLQWIRYVLANIDPLAEIYLHGVSMGGATVLMVSEFRLPENVKAIIADCAYTDVWEILNHVFKRKYHMPMAPVMEIANLICKRKAGYSFKNISTVDALTNNSLPVLFIHGSEDDFVPVEMSRVNYDACVSEKKELVIVDNANHAESFYRNPELYEKAVFGFIE